MQWGIRRHLYRRWRKVYYLLRFQLVGTSNRHRSTSAVDIDKGKSLKICFCKVIEKSQYRKLIHTALTPFSCCAMLSTMMVMTCQRMLRSAKSSQGFLASKPTKLSFSFWISSSTMSEPAEPCNWFRAADRKRGPLFTFSLTWLLYDRLLFFFKETKGQTTVPSHHHEIIRRRSHGLTDSLKQFLRSI